MSLVRINPGRNRNQVPYFQDVFDTLFNDSVNRNFRFSNKPSVNISENEKQYQIELAAPGLNKEDFKITIVKDQLVISGEKKTENTENQKEYSRKEFEFYSFERSFALPDDVDQDQIKAEYVNGVLQIDVAKKDSSTPAHKEVLVK